MSHAVVRFVVAEGHNVRGQHVHQVDGGQALVFGVDDGSPEHVSGHRVDHVFFFAAHFADVAGKPR